MANLSEVEAQIDAFLKDAARSTLELSGSAQERKRAKQVAEGHPGLKCESFGFGNDRQLHIFKPPSPDAAPPPQAVNVKNTFIDDWASAEAVEPVVFRSVPPQLQKGAVPLTLAERLEPSVARLEPALCTPERPKALVRASSPDCSTTCSMTTSSPASSSRDILAASGEGMLPPPGLPLPPGLQVRNTFIHVENTDSDSRAIQSMPHGMFGKCLMAELDKNKPAKVEPVATYSTVAPSEPVPAEELTKLQENTAIIVQGLQKLPEFNGLSGTVQSFDDATQRYNISLITRDGTKSAKVKRENLLRKELAPSMAPRFAPQIFIDPAAGGYLNSMDIPATPWAPSAFSPGVGMPR